jgi:nitrogen fixation-related uncharacterized protein
VKKLTTQIRVTIGISVFFMLIGFLVITIRPENIFIGLVLSFIAVSVLFFALGLAIRLAHLDKKQKDDRIKKLEEDVEVLRRRDSSR